MDSLFLIGGLLGIGAYLAKLGLFLLITKPFPRFRHWVHTKPLALAGTDIAGGFLASHMLSGSMLGMVGNITFGICSMTFIGCVMFHNWFKTTTAGKFVLGKPAKYQSDTSRYRRRNRYA